MGAPLEAQGRGGLFSMATSKIGRGQSGGVNGGQRQGLIKGLRYKIAQEDSLYLMIVEEPGDGVSRGAEQSNGYIAELHGSQMSPYIAESEGGMGQRSSSGVFRSETYREDDNRRN